MVVSGDDNEAAVVGATVEVFGTEISAVTDGDGLFSLSNVPNGDAFFVTTASGNWGIVDYYEVPGETANGINLGVVPDDEITAVDDALDDRTISESDGFVDILFEGANGGETGMISASSDAPFTFDSLEEPQIQNGIIVDASGEGELFFTSVDPAVGTVTATVEGVPNVTDCDVDESPGTTYPIMAKSITIVYAGCRPAQ
jgi:hypothetical protein